MKYLYYLICLILVGSGVILMVTYGINPRPVPKIKPSEFSDSNHIVNSILLRMREEIKAAPLLFLGAFHEAPEQVEIWKRFLAQNREEGFKYDLVLVDPQIVLPPDFPEHRVYDVKNNLDLFAQSAKQALAEGKRVVVLVPSIYSSQLLPLGPARQLIENHQLKITSISLTPFGLSIDETKQLPVICIAGGDDPTGTSPLGCAMMRKSQLTYRTKLDRSKIIGLMEQFGLTDYIFFLRMPK